MLRRNARILIVLVVGSLLLMHKFAPPLDLEVKSPNTLAPFDPALLSVTLAPLNATKCRNTIQGPQYSTDERGFTCKWQEVNSKGCCPETSKRYSCDSCRSDNCCALFESCVACCLSPSHESLLQAVVRRTAKELRPLLNTVSDRFELCVAKCRTSSTSVQHENKDLAARNCLVADGPIVKISDFGLGRILSENMYYKTEGGCLPIRWLSPEAVLYGKFTSQSDVWAYGVILYEVFTWGGRPYESMSNMEVAAALTSNSLKPLRVHNAPSIINDLMENCFDYDPNKRPSFATLERRLKEFGSTLGEEGDDCEGARVPENERTPQEADSGAVLKAGWLVKQGGGTSAFGKNNWKKRWFELRRDGTMTYSKTNKKGAKPLGYIDIKTCSQVTVEKPFDSSFGMECCFTIVMPQRTYALVSDSKKECRAWVEHLKSIL